MSEETVGDSSAREKMQGCVKWFNNKQGFGFISVTSGEKLGTDLFVHHSAIQVGKEQYKYLVQGEYVQFELCKADQASHEWQAGNVRGLDNGKLMCETRHDTRITRTNSMPNSMDSGNRMDESDRQTDRRVRVRGSGPRETREGEEWFLIKRRVGNGHQSRDRTTDGDHDRRVRRDNRPMAPRM